MTSFINELSSGHFLKREGTLCFFFQAEVGIRDYKVTGVQTCALPICTWRRTPPASRRRASNQDCKPLPPVAENFRGADDIPGTMPCYAAEQSRRWTCDSRRRDN